jgi:phospholipase C
MLDSFDHVVVLMLENRSFDNILGYMYPDGPPTTAPAGKTFEGVAGKSLCNPVPSSAVHQPPSGATSIEVSPGTDYFQPYPDPGEEYHHVNTQLFNLIDGGDKPPYNLPDPVPSRPAMQGFINDYIENFKTAEEPGKEPTYDQYRVIMDCFATSAVPIITGLAENFAVFDHWFCAVPSQTWCNRAFWNAGTSWGHVNNGGGADENSASWAIDSSGTTIFNQIEDSGWRSPLDWKVYSSNIAALTGIIHAEALALYHVWPANHFPSLEQFYDDCAGGQLPACSFLEPNFWTPHNDMHPSTYDSEHYGKSSVGSVLLGEHLIWKVYNAIKDSKSSRGNNSQNTLLIITFDEHGGCYDHVAPPSHVTPPDLSDYTQWSDFDFKRLGVRVPTVMVSAHIAENTIINTPMHHASFLKTMQTKWNRVTPGKFTTLTARQANAPEFTEVFTSENARRASDWPDFPEPQISKEFYDIDFSDSPLSDLHRSMVRGVAALPQARGLDVDVESIGTHSEAIDFLRSVPGLPGHEPRR